MILSVLGNKYLHVAGVKNLVKRICEVVTSWEEKTTTTTTATDPLKGNVAPLRPGALIW